MVKLPDGHTGLYDSNGQAIMIGAVVMKWIEDDHPKSVHGSWVKYKVKQQGMTPILSYLCSEKGQVLPAGYTASILADSYDSKMFLFMIDLRGLEPLERMVVVPSE